MTRALAILTPFQRNVVALTLRGHSNPEVAARLKLSINHVTVLLSQARARIRAEGIRADGVTCPAGHLQTHDPCKECQKARRHAAIHGRHASLTPRVDMTARQRVDADIAAGKRCRRCWLLLPCGHS